MISAGVDAGSRAVKVVLVDNKNESILAKGVADQGVDQEGVALSLLDETLQSVNLTRADLGRIVATGYARSILRFAHTTITEITCHGCGVHVLLPNARTVIEIGGQDSKVLVLAPTGEVRDFAMNDRCAAGTGRFLEVVAKQLGTRLDDLLPLLALVQAPASISSTCVVFAETEIVSLLAKKTAPADILAGVQRSIAERIASMAGRLISPPVAFTGGVAMVPGMTAVLESILRIPLLPVPSPQFTGALGAAVLAGR